MIKKIATGLSRKETLLLLKPSFASAFRPPKGLRSICMAGALPTSRVRRDVSVFSRTQYPAHSGRRLTAQAMRPFSTAVSCEAFDRVHSYIRNIMREKGSTYRFQYSFICDQHIKYEPRVLEEAAVCDLMRTRWQNRRNSSLAGSSGAEHNPLICLTGAVRDGKSSFLANLPLSASYRSWLKERYPDVADPQPIVALYSLVSHYNRGGEPEIGLRLLHGALASMGVIVDSPMWWDYELFRAHVFGNGNEYHEYDKAAVAAITVEGAVEMLWELFGRDRPFLLLHDKTSTIKDIAQAQGVLDSLHELVVKHESLDVVVSARSHQYRGARPPSTPQQHIQYVQLQPLPRSKQVEEITREWAEYVRGRYEASPDSRMGGRVFRLLTGAHLLAGHHAGSVEMMTEWFRECIDEQIDVFPSHAIHTVQYLLESLIYLDSRFMYVKRFYFGSGGSNKDMHEYLDTQAFTQRGKSTLSSGLYWSTLNKPPADALHVTIHTPWYTAIYPTQVLQLQAAMIRPNQYRYSPYNVSPKHKHLRDFQAIFAREGAVAMDLESVLEPCVVMSALTTLRETRDCDLSAAFGCAFPVTKTIATPFKGICVTDADSLPLRSVLQQEPDVLLLSSGPQEGYSALFRLHEGADNKPLYAYLQIPTASARAHQQDLSEVLVTAVKHILRAHSQLPGAGAGVDLALSSGGVNPNKVLLEQLYVIFYDAGNPMDSMALDYAALQDVAQQQLTRAAEQGLEAQSPAAEEEDAYLPVVLEFLHHHQGNLQVVTQPQLRDFLIPSFVPLMELANHVYGPEDLPERCERDRCSGAILK